MSVNQLLLWEKYRPKTMEDLILPKRIRNHFENGITRNYIFHGSYGSGKTSLARILIGKYTNDKAFIEFNSSIDTSVNILRDEINTFCKTVPMLMSDDPIKYVFLDEFERVSAEYQDALKGFVESYHKNVRFILVSNHFNKIEDGIKSRFTDINFNPQNSIEVKEMKNGMFKRLKYIAETEEIDIDQKALIGIVNKNFPDNRSMVTELELISQLGKSENIKVGDTTKKELYEMIYNQSATYQEMYNFLMSSFGPEKMDELFQFLGRDFMDYSISHDKNVDKLFECNYVISDYRDKLESKTDPIILGMSVTGKFRDILL